MAGAALVRDGDAPDGGGRAATAPALRLAGLLGVLAQAVIIGVQLATYLAGGAIAELGGINGSELAGTGVRLLQLVTALATLTAAWIGRRGPVWVGAGLVVVLLVLRMALHVPHGDVRAAAAWVTSALPTLGAACVLARGFRPAAHEVDLDERLGWLRSAPVGAVALTVLITVGQHGAPVPHTWTMLYAIMLVVLLVAERVAAGTRSVSSVESATTWRALALLALFMIPVQAKDLILPVDGRPPFPLIAEVAATLLVSLAAWVLARRATR